MFAGLAIGASRTGDPVWVLAAAALTLQTLAPRDRLLVPGLPAPGHRRHAAAADREPVRRAAPGRAAPEPVETDEVERGGRAGAAAPARADDAAAACSVLWRAGDRTPGPLGQEDLAFPIGERFATISITAALFDARITFIVMLAWGGFATPTSCSAGC